MRRGIERLFAAATTLLAMGAFAACSGEAPHSSATADAGVDAPNDSGAGSSVVPLPVTPVPDGGGTPPSGEARRCTAPDLPVG